MILLKISTLLNVLVLVCWLKRNLDRGHLANHHYHLCILRSSIGVRKLEAEMPGHEETAAEVAPAEEESDHDEEEEESSRLHQTGREVEFDYQDYVKK